MNRDHTLENDLQLFFIFERNSYETKDRCINIHVDQNKNFPSKEKGEKG